MASVESSAQIRGRIWRIEISALYASECVLAGGGLDRDGQDISLKKSRVFYVKGDLAPEDVQVICKRLLCDAVVEQYHIAECGIRAKQDGPPQVAAGSDRCAAQSSTSDSHVLPAVEILPKPGVTDPVAASTLRAIADLGLRIDDVKTGWRYECDKSCSRDDLRHLAETRLGNPLIHQTHYSGFAEQEPPPEPFIEPSTYVLEIKAVSIISADDVALTSLSKRGHLFLNLAEMRAIKAYYRRLERDPTDVELETIAQTWSEHCVHKTLKSEVHYRGCGFPEEIELEEGSGVRVQGSGGQIDREYKNLLADTIVRATRELDLPWCLSVFEDNAGVIEFDDQYGIAFKVETHNHPSALEPYGGAATGLGGCIRDILGCGLGARPIANTDVFCFADPMLPEDRIPAGVIHPARCMREVVRGVRDYGNRMGIPTVNGAIVFDNRYLANPLVYCGCVGLIPKNRLRKSPRKGDRILVVGGRTGRDGIHGATFSSGGMTDTHATEFAHAVQIGNAITEKKMMDVLLQARDHEAGCLYSCITDCGAGGLSSAVGEMGEHLGAVVELDQVPLKYAGLRYDEIWISEAQERMLLAVPPERVHQLISLCKSEGVEATDIGEFTGDGRLVLNYDGTVVGELDMQFLHNGLPKTARAATWHPTNAVHGAANCESSQAESARAPDQSGFHPARGSLSDDLQSALLARLSDPNIASKAWVIRQYDHEVQGGSVIKPLMGPGRGPSDGAVIRPVWSSDKAIALSCGLCPHLSDVDPYVMAVAAVDEAVRNNICVGGDLSRMAILDNFCWGGVSTEQEMGELVRAAQGCHDAAVAYGTPFISGKDSLNNVFELRRADAAQMNWPERISIPGTLLISALSVLSDFRRCRTSDIKSVGNHIVTVQPRGKRIADYAAAARAVCQMLAEVEGLRSCHDVSEGGLLVAIAEMVIGGRYGVKLELVAEDLFAERLGCYVIEVTASATSCLLEFNAVCLKEVGTVIEVAQLQLNVSGLENVWEVDDLRRAWHGPLHW